MLHIQRDQILPLKCHDPCEQAMGMVQIGSTIEIISRTFCNQLDATLRTDRADPE